MILYKKEGGNIRVEDSFKHNWEDYTIELSVESDLGITYSRLNIEEVTKLRDHLNKVLLNEREITLEDFHIGFEYEELVTNSERYVVGLGGAKHIWTKKVYSLKSARLGKIDQLIELGKIRKVKS